MATSMGPNFTGHPAGMAHQAVAGHPMGPGMPPNAAQQGAPGGGMPHQFGGGHMAVSGPGGQVNPALMGAMPPGANPHTLQHLTPAQQQLFQHQQHQQQLQNQFHNPSAMAAMRQHHLLQHQQQQARQALMAQQAVHANMGVGNGMPMGIPMNQLSPQQIQHLRQTGRLAPGQHPAQVMAQQLALQQQQQQQAQQQAQQQQHAAQQASHNQQIPGGPNQVQHMPMNAQSMASVQQQNQMGGAGGQNQMGGQQQPGGQQTQGQAQGQPQGQPPQPGQQAQQAQQTPQQSSQAGTPGPSGQQTPSQTPAPTPAQANQMQQGQGQGQPQQAHPQAQQHMSAAAAAQQLAMTNSIFQQQRREGMRGQCLLKLMQFGECLSGFPGAKGKDDLSYWNMFVGRFFSANSVFRHSLHFGDAEDTTDKQYEIAYPAIARYFHTHYASGVKSMQLILDKGVTDRPLAADSHCIENARASFVYWFETGSHLVATGTLRAHFDTELKFELFEFFTTGHEEYISRKQVIDAAKPAHMWFKEWHKANAQDGKQSPEMSKKSKAKPLKSPQTQPPEVLVDLPDSAVNSKGVTEAVHQFLEIVEVMGQMNPLFGFCHSNPGVGPYAALDQYVSTYINGGPPAMNGHAMPQGPRTPGFGQFAMGASPATTHMNLPGSPHIGSPAPGQMQAPGMQLQPSQQGTSSSGPSANTSPASNKRRRPSGIKEEDGSGAPTPVGSGPQMNGAPNRANKPPTPRMLKRVKGNPS